MRRIRSLFLAAVLAAASSPTLAQNCAGFTDVLASNPFCQQVEWIKNRAITLGCSATTYCPADSVTRLQMAAFLKRFGDAVTPVDLAPVSAAGASVVPAAATRVCVTPDYVVSGFPRRAYINAAAIVSAPSAGIDVLAEIEFSTNAGATWTPIVGSDHYATLYAGAAPPNQTTLTPFGQLDLDVGQTVRFAVHLDRFAGTAGTSITAACLNRVQIANRNGTATPFDAQVVTRARGG